MKKFFVLIMLGFLTALLTLSVTAEAASGVEAQNEKYVSPVGYGAAWEAAADRVFAIESAKISDDERCLETWNILWPWAKKGNLEARVFIALRVVSFLHMPYWRMPDDADDVLSRRRHAFIMIVHSSGIPDSGDEPTLNQIFVDYIQGFSFPGKKSLLSCLQEPKSLCAQGAVEQGVVPSFEVYAKEIDRNIAQGLKPRCSYPPDR